MSPILVGKKHNFSATTDPTVNDDSGDGYSVGSYWFDTTKDYVWYCYDASVGAAGWWLMQDPTPGSTAADWRLPDGIVTITDRTPSASAHVAAWPFFFPRLTVIDNVRINVTTGQAGAEARCGLYLGSSRPTALIADLGTVDCSSSGDKDFAANSSVAGTLWVLVYVKNVATQATFKAPSTVASGHGIAQISSTLSTPTSGRPFLYAIVAYPGSAPDPATAVIATTTISVVLPMVQVA